MKNLLTMEIEIGLAHIRVTILDQSADLPRTFQANDGFQVHKGSVVELRPDMVYLVGTNDDVTTASMSVPSGSTARYCERLLGALDQLAYSIDPGFVHHVDGPVRRWTIPNGEVQDVV